MYSTNIQPSTRKGQSNYKSICDGFGCANEATEKLGVSAGTFGTITLSLCSKCVTIFKEYEV
jgi:hypothetical protein